MAVDSTVWTGRRRVVEGVALRPLATRGDRWPQQRVSLWTVWRCRHRSIAKGIHTYTCVTLVCTDVIVCVRVGVCGNQLCDARRHVSVCQLCAWTTHRTSCWLSFVHGVGGCQSCCCICIHFHCELYFPLLICRCSQADSYENTSRAFVNTAIGDAGTAEDLVADEALMLSDFTRVMKKCHQNFKYYNCFFFSIIVIWCVVIIGCSSSS